MRVTICDVCGEQFDVNAVMIEMSIPGRMLNQDVDESIDVDVCGWSCVTTMVQGVLSDTAEEEEVTPEETPAGFVAVPKTPTIGTDMDEKTLARFTEQVTGVRRR
jgi:hypothetical protein